ncbi:MAG: RimK family alpha-L-glutamate ligase, partial [Bacteroidales bacterium]|nr:RimK family alpha-L-glutamate ligase [Bacteroidales bacterium]
MNIIILNSNPKSSATRSLVRAGHKLGAQGSTLDPSFMSPFVSNVGGHDRLYDMLAGSRKRLAANSIGCIVPRFATNVRYNTMVLQHMTDNLKIPSVQSAEGIRIAANKWHTIQACSKNGVRTPRTVYSSTMKDVDYLIDKIGKLPLVAKYNYGSMGSSVMILDSKRTAISTIQSLIKNKADFIIQEFISGGGKDIRIVVVGGKVIASYERSAEKGEWRSNISMGASAVSIEITPEEEIMALKAASAVGLEVCGVDIMRNEQRVPYLIEVNSNFGFKGQKITGVNFAEKIMQYAIQKANNRATVIDTSGKLPDAIYAKHFKRVESQLKYFTENPEIMKSFEKAKGKTLRFSDRNGNRKSQLIESPKDLYNVIFETFKIG